MSIKEIKQEPFLFASKRVIIQEKADFKDYIQEIKDLCEDHITGPLYVIRHYDYPGPGLDYEIGYPVNRNIKELNTYDRNYNEYLSGRVKGTMEMAAKLGGEIYKEMYAHGISPGMEYIEIYHILDPDDEMSEIEIRAAMHMWVTLYHKSLHKHITNLGSEDIVASIFAGGEKMHAFTPIEERVAWVTETLERLKSYVDVDSQFHIISDIALTRPQSDIDQYKKVYVETGSMEKVMEKLMGTHYFPCKQRVDGNIIYSCKTPRNKEGYLNAKTFEEKRQAYCFCILTAMSKNPTMDPIFCFRAAGWAKQLFEGVLEKKVKTGRILKSILKGDDYCEFTLEFDTIP
ncbi:MAG: hypothetical protein INQ03_11870 [Candidatus Heimdallarchaeota archaeon]|nr:hypothetical protein [Candidatus Heimdallarchaeota archaeon]